MDRFSANGQITAVTATPGDTALGIIASTLVRAKIHFFTVAAGGTPVADNVLQWLVRRFTAAGTSTAYTPVQLDLGSPVSQLTVGTNHTVEPTYTGILFNLQVHQRSLYQWNAAPAGEILIPAVAASGIGFTPIHASYVSTANANAHWQE